MSLLINDGVVLSNPTSTDRNSINSNGNNLEFNTNAGNVRLDSLSEIQSGKSIIFSGANSTIGEIHKLTTLLGRTNTLGIVNGSQLKLKTNNTDQVTINSSGVANFVNNPQLNTPTLTSSTNQLMSMYNIMTMTDYTLTLTSNTGSATLSSSSIAKYIKMGNFVFVVINLIMTSIGTIPAGESIRISLPFSTAAGTVQGLNISRVANLNFSTIATVFDITASIAANSNFAAVFGRINATDDNPTAIVGSQLNNNTEFSMSGFYLI